jgi:hypothetical protein
MTNKLKQEFTDNGLIDAGIKVNYALAAGPIHYGSEDRIKANFDQKGWKLFTPNMIKTFIRESAQKGWENDLVIMTLN